MNHLVRTILKLTKARPDARTSILNGIIGMRIALSNISQELVKQGASVL